MDTWPASWREGYERFDRFLKTRDLKWPTTQLSFSPNGVIQTEEWTPSERTKNQSIFVYQSGALFGSSGIKKVRDGEPFTILNHLPSGQPTAAVTQVTGDMGYQHIFPLRWFEIVPEAGLEMSLYGGESRVIRELPTPKPEASYWPNERLLAWLDFQILPHHHPADIRERNGKVTPAAVLQVDDMGTVHRANMFGEAEEKLLQWRVYYNGRLVRDEPVGGKERLALAEHGAGIYIVLLGLDGPQGFLPISNLLQFVLSPQDDREGLRLLFFTQFDSRRSEDYPTWYRNILPPPLGKGPVNWADPEQLLAARKLVVAYKGAASLFNKEDASWVFRPEPSEPKKKGDLPQSN